MNYEIFNNRKVCIFIPHQDDEINIAYGLVYKIKNIVKDIKIIFSTNGNSIVKEKYRIKEGIDSLKVIGIEKKDIVFMGYSDQIPEEITHLYHENSTWLDNNNNALTSTPLNSDYHFLKYNTHATFNKNNFINDIKDLIQEFLPDIIIGIDLDSHPDHRALSLSLEKALGIIFKECTQYRPIVLKSFAYPTSYKGYKDFSYNNKSTRFLKEENSLYELHNPYYDWNDRIIFKNPKKATNYLFLNNIYFYGLLKHKSQYILNRIEQIINNDLIYFERNTNNLLYNAKITTSSGDSQFLNDFMLFDTDNIMGGITKKLNFNKGYTILEKEDNKKQIVIKFSQKYDVNTIKIYIKPETQFKIHEIRIKNNKKIITTKFEFHNFTYTFSNLNLKNIFNLTIEFDSNDNVCIGEIEIFDKIKKIEYALLSINNNVYNEYYYTTEPKVKII